MPIQESGLDKTAEVRARIRGRKIDIESDREREGYTTKRQSDREIENVREHAGKSAAWGTECTRSVRHQEIE